MSGVSTRGLKASNSKQPSGRTLVILNPAAGRGRAGRIRAKVLDAFSHAGMTYDLVETNAAGEGVQAASQAGKAGYTTIIAVGGDGTISEIVNGLGQATAPEEPIGTVGILAVGSGNDFAHALGISQDLEQAAQTLVVGRTRACDLGYATICTAESTIERYFNNNLGLGLDPQVALESLLLKRLQGLLLYGVAALRALWRYQPPVMHLQWVGEDGRRDKWHDALLLASVGNTPRSGGGFHLAPHAEVDDGLLDLVFAGALSRWQVLQLLPKTIVGKHLHHPAITFARISHLQIRGAVPFPVELDGEVITQRAEHMEIGIHPQRLQVIV